MVSGAKEASDLSEHCAASIDVAPGINRSIDLRLEWSLDHLQVTALVHVLYDDWTHVVTSPTIFNVYKTRVLPRP